MRKMKNGMRFWLSFFLSSFALLSLEVLITRLFSLTLWHNFAYLVISIAFLGIGAGGVWESIFREKRKEVNLSFPAFFSSLSTWLIFHYAGKFDFQPGSWGIWVLAILSFLVFFPFFFLGLILVRVFNLYSERIGFVYGINLFASGLGVVLSLVFLPGLGMSGSLILICLLLALSSLGFSRSMWSKAFLILWLIFLLTGFSWKDRWFEFQVTTTKTFGKFQKAWQDFKLEFSRWDPLGRVDVFASPTHSWLKFENEAYFYRGLTIDGAADTTLIDFKDQLFDTRFFKGSTYGQAFLLYGRRPEKVLVIGVGGGPDLQSALHFQAQKIIGVEVNGSVLLALKKFLPRLASNPKITLLKSDGRSYVARSKEKYDIIQISGVDTVSALEWGAYIQAENYVHTLDAYMDYLKHLKPEGILSIGLVELHPPRNMFRACVMLVEAMRRLGIEHPERKIILVQQAQYIQLLARKKDFTSGEIKRYQALLKQYTSPHPITFELRYLYGIKAPLWLRYAPGVENPENTFTQFFQKVKQNQEKNFILSYPFDIRPVSDDKPFFYKYYYFPFLDFSPDALGEKVLYAQILEAVLLSGLFIFLPILWLRRWQAPGLGKRLWFFLFIGLGYMMIEIPLIQRFVLYLEHPTYSLGLVLAGLLIFSGLGSWLYQRYFFSSKTILWIGVGAIFLINLLSLWLVPILVFKTFSLELWGRALISLLWVGALGIFMGIPFPAGIRRLEENSPGLIPWVWAVNTSASVVASILAVILAMGLGFKMVSLIAGGCYLLAGACFPLLAGRE